jgi:hypothetical protein
MNSRHNYMKTLDFMWISAWFKAFYLINGYVESGSVTACDLGVKAKFSVSGGRNLLQSFRGSPSNFPPCKPKEGSIFEMRLQVTQPVIGSTVNSHAMSVTLTFPASPCSLSSDQPTNILHLSDCVCTRLLTHFRARNLYSPTDRENQRELSSDVSKCVWRKSLRFNSRCDVILEMEWKCATDQLEISPHMVKHIAYWCEELKSLLETGGHSNV